MDMVINFANVSSAIAAEQALSQAGILAMVMPTPSSVQAGCGFCLRLPPQSLDAAIERLDSDGVSYSGVFSRSVEQGGDTYVPLGAFAAGGV
ncbi:MAG: DUF3343 domain-containing protein [Synergistaceae bacterium]|jgi:hypothetical protein|nr:DUF3343 domain-containing protein [Synergistaceae bacterium]